jgi:hypothetical protein
LFSWESDEYDFAFPVVQIRITDVLDEPIGRCHVPSNLPDVLLLSNRITPIGWGEYAGLSMLNEGTSMVSIRQAWVTTKRHL